jgi:hypothetical protein
LDIQNNALTTFTERRIYGNILNFPHHRIKYDGRREIGVESTAWHAVLVAGTPSSTLHRDRWAFGLAAGVKEPLLCQPLFSGLFLQLQEDTFTLKSV